MKRRLIAMAGFLFPLFLVMTVDLLWLDRRYYHHFGDYCTLFGLGLGWLDSIPYVNFPWPLWGLGQFSALAAVMGGLQPEDLFLFNLIWVGLNLFSAGLAAWITARLIEEVQAPPWASVVFGSVLFTVPMVSTGWIHSNPYFVLIVLSGPASVVVLRQLLGFGRPTGLCRYEWVALFALGYIVANNFAGGILMIGFVAAALLLKPLRLLTGQQLSENIERGSILDVLFVLLGALALVSVGGYFQVQSVSAGHATGLYLLFALGLALAVRRSLFSRAEKSVGVGVLLGWLAGVNVLVLQYGRAAKIAMTTASAPTAFQLFAPWPHIDWAGLGAGTHWFLFLLLAYIIGVLSLFAGAVRVRSVHAMMLIGCGIFVVVVLYLNGLVAQAHWVFPLGHNNLRFGVNYRYLWVSVAAVYAAIFILFVCCKNRIIIGAFASLVLVGATFAFNQAMRSKAVIVAAIDQDCRVLDKLIDEHLQASAENLVLVANANFPNRANLLYAYHNARVGLGHIKRESLLSGRIRYIGRYGGGMWQSPSAIMKETNVGNDAILVIAEAADKYPDELKITHSLPNTLTLVLKLTLPPF